MNFVVTSSSALVKPPLLDKNDAIRLWFANRRLNQTMKLAVQRKEKYKASAATAARRCTELESKLVEIERRASAAESRVEQLNRELMKCESREPPCKPGPRLRLTGRLHLGSLGRDCSV